MIRHLDRSFRLSDVCQAGDVSGLAIRSIINDGRHVYVVMIVRENGSDVLPPYSSTTQAQGVTMARITKPAKAAPAKAAKKKASGKKKASAKKRASKKKAGRWQEEAVYQEVVFWQEEASVASRQIATLKPGLCTSASAVFDSAVLDKGQPFFSGFCARRLQLALAAICESDYGDSVTLGRALALNRKLNQAVCTLQRLKTVRILCTHATNRPFTVR